MNKTLLKDQTYSKPFWTVLNSRFMDWFFRITSTNNHVQGYEVEQLPIASMDASAKIRLSHLADRILKAKYADPNVDTRAVEIVYKLYGLTEEEVEVVEDRQIDR